METQSSPLRSTSGVATGVSSFKTRADGPSSSKQVTTRGGAKSESKQVDAASHNGLYGTHVAWPEKRVLVEGNGFVMASAAITMCLSLAKR